MSTEHLSAAELLSARIDVSAICASLEVSVDGATRSDLNLFAYLSYMVSTQMEPDTLQWGYTFAVRPNGLPFAEAIEVAADEMIDRGELIDGPAGLVVSRRFRPTFDAIARSRVFARRIMVVRGVCKVSVFRDLPGIGRAVRRSPQLAPAASIEAVRLVEDADTRYALAQLSLKVKDQLSASYLPSEPAMLWLDEWEQVDA